MVKVEQHRAEYGNDTKRHPANELSIPPGFHLPELPKDSISCFSYSWNLHHVFLCTLTPSSREKKFSQP